MSITNEVNEMSRAGLEIRAYTLFPEPEEDSCLCQSQCHTHGWAPANHQLTSTPAPGHERDEKEKEGIEFYVPYNMFFNNRSDFEGKC